jgi:hypothetical protein
MADAGGGRTSKPLKPVPATMAMPAQTSRDRVAEYDTNRQNNIELERLRKQKEAIVANLNVADESGIIGALNLLHQDQNELQKLKPQVASLPGLQAELDARNLLLEEILNTVLENDFVNIVPEIKSKDSQIAKLTAQTGKLPALHAEK